VLGPSDYHHLPVVVIGEYQFGLRLSRSRRKLQSLFAKLEGQSVVLAPDRSTADWYASVRYALKSSGRPIPENDVWVAALARQHNRKSSATTDILIMWMASAGSLGDHISRATFK
jgi:predicted nucleic acid-binding protein